MGVQSLDKKKSEPALILRAALVGSVDAAHAEDDCGKAEGAGIIEHVLVGRAFGAAVGAVEIEALIFRNATAADVAIDRLITFAVQPQPDLIEMSINFVGRSKDERRRIGLSANRF